MAIGGPYLVKSMIGEEVSEEALGGSKVHTEVSGVADLETASDAECLAAVREYLSYFPSRCGEKPPRRPRRIPRTAATSLCSTWSRKIPGKRTTCTR